MRTYVNPMEGQLPIYADSDMTHKIGSLFKGSTCQCVGEQNNMAIVLYKISEAGKYKVGFADPQGIQAW